MLLKKAALLLNPATEMLPQSGVANEPPENDCQLSPLQQSINREMVYCACTVSPRDVTRTAQAARCRSVR